MRRRPGGAGRRGGQAVTRKLRARYGDSCEGRVRSRPGAWNAVHFVPVVRHGGQFPRFESACMKLGKKSADFAWKECEYGVYSQPARISQPGHLADITEVDPH